ncbi:polysaccharide pyruvyl transferase family protein [Aeromonas caviae]|uniref:polysaccharide pyruvyl transferase family protein n=1 Tax=Aeromonas caviae TaxID=648 RepID=UPI000D652B1D|nr:polysaccharide pyruvyl transferase family protein [Aeromonas caviae]
MTKKIVIVPACTDLNRGDQALVWETAFLLKDAFLEDVSVKIVDYGNNDDDRYRQSIQTKNAGFEVVRNITENPKRYLNNSEIHNKFHSFISAGFVALLDFIRQLTLLLLPYDRVFNILFHSKDYRDTFKVLQESDAVVIKGGGYLHTYGKVEDLYYLWFGLYYVLLAKRLKKKVIIFPNSIGPITGVLNRAFFKYTVSKVDLIFAREKISKEYLISMGIENCHYAFDLGYYALREKVPSNKKSIIKKDGMLNIGITVRPYRFPKSANPEKSYRQYIESIATYCNENYDNNFFYFIVQVQGPSAHETDLLAINDVVSLLSKNVSHEIIDDNYNYRELLDIYSNMDYVIGTRFHSVIFSQIMGVPSIAIAYGGNKSRGIMRELDLEDFVVDIESISSDVLTSMMNNLERNKTAYINNLKKSKSVIANDRVNVIEKVRKLWQ